MPCGRFEGFSIVRSKGVKRVYKPIEKEIAGELVPELHYMSILCRYLSFRFFFFSFLDRFFRPNKVITLECKRIHEVYSDIGRYK